MKSSKKTNIILFLVALVIIVAPLILKSGAEFAGADDQAEDAITKINKDYKPWAEHIWEPPSGEVESLLFAVQASIGTAVVAYYFGYMKGKRKSAVQEKMQGTNKNSIKES
ncbi:energy-coupling factor ABC transporter substrate-binding protein [Clostridiaceae bacterium 14S0207]|nr:energy-coupling factor ABC transporter substrate-binding protein [Clostridiaceae bacterium 14S0207]